MDEKISRVMASSTANATAIEHIRCLLEGYLGKSKDVVEGSPSLTESALENQDSGGMRQVALPGVKPNLRPKVVSMAGLADTRTPVKRATTVGNAEGGGRVSKTRGVAHSADVPVISDNDAGETEAPPTQSPQWKVAERAGTPQRKRKRQALRRNPRIPKGQRMWEIPPPPLQKHGWHLL